MRISKVKGIAFDLDGLLADTEPLQYEAFRQTLAQFGIELSKEEFIRRWIDEKTEFSGAIKDYELKIGLKEIRAIKHGFYHKLLENVKPRPGAVELVNELEGIIDISVVSHSFRKDVNNVLKLIGLADYFQDRVVAKEDVLNHKPHPDPYIQGALKMGVPAENCVAIEDAPNGIISAKRAGMYCIAVPNEFTASLDFSQADLIVKSLEEVSHDVIMSFAEKKQKTADNNFDLENKIHDYGDFCDVYIFVFNSDSIKVGQMTCSYWKKDSCLFVTDMITHPYFARQGVGTSCFRELLNVLEKNNLGLGMVVAKEVGGYSPIAEIRQGVESFYKSLGFQQDGKSDRWYVDKDTLITKLNEKIKIKSEQVC